MPFNPTLPAFNSPIVSAELRDQFNGLKDLIDETIPASEKGAPNGVASLNASGNLVQPANWNNLANKPLPVADGTYTVGIGTQQNGTITVVDGIVTAIQEAQDVPAAFVASGFGESGVNGPYFEDGTLHDFPRYRTATGNFWLVYLDSPNQYTLAVGNDGSGTLLYFNLTSGTNPVGTYDINSGPAPAGTIAPA